MEAHEIAEQIHENAEDEAHTRSVPEVLRRFTGIYVGVVAMLLAITTLGGGNATKEMLNANIHASDTFAFYQSKYARQVQYLTTAEELELLSAGAGLPPDRAAHVEQLTKHYRDIAARYESDPATHDGKKELLARAHEWEVIRDHAVTQTPNFEYAEALFQIAIVLGSVSLVAASPWLLGASGLLSFVGLILMLNGFVLVVPLSAG
ncbi:MAG TPA: DUF4337 domain-containing protein [Stellaceae bacterium]|nr:DUF4337 domain-containing protein [Stellaceae bacterium]